MVRFKRSRLLLTLIIVSIIFWFMLYWKVLDIYTHQKQLWLSNSEGQLPLPDDEFPVDVHSRKGRMHGTNIYDEDYLEKLGKVNTAQDQRNYDAGYHNHAFNEMLSKKLSYTRPIPDMRNAKCRRKSYVPDLPSTSVIICFYNEAMSALLRTVHSVLERSPEHLIHEIILVDDFSDMSHLKTELENYIYSLPKVKLIRSTEDRLGLIRARILGARKATGQVLLFLDSHCEVNVGWLEPLLAPIQSDSHTVVVPIIDIIDSDTFRYEPSGAVRGGFNWGMHFQWEALTITEAKISFEKADPYATPTMAGGLFAMDRSYFHHLGEYDSGMDIWGGENLEMSFRLWQCGGRLVIAPCSRVGHIFRKRRPYGAPVHDSFVKNTLRMVNVWLDEYKQYYFHINPRAEDMEYGNISSRLQLRKDLKCKSFKWYLENIYPEQLEKLPDLSQPLYPKQDGQPKGNFVPAKVEIRSHGLLKHLGSGLCVESEKSIYDKRALLHLAICKPGPDKNQVWYETELKDFRLGNLLCLDYNRIEGPYARLLKCKGSNSQSWIWAKKGTQHNLINYGTSECLVATGVEPGALLKTTYCSDSPLMYFELVRSED